MNKNFHKAFAVTTIVAGFVATASVLFLQSGGLVTPYHPSALDVAVASASASAVSELPTSLDNPPPPPPDLPSSLAAIEVPEVKVVGKPVVKRPKASDGEGVARPYCHRHRNVIICDPKEHLRTSNRYRDDHLVDDYRKDFLRLLED